MVVAAVEGRLVGIFIGVTCKLCLCSCNIGLGTKIKMN